MLSDTNALFSGPKIHSYINLLIDVISFSKTGNTMFQFVYCHLYLYVKFWNTECVILVISNCVYSRNIFSLYAHQEQLGYIVFSGIRRSNGVQGLRVIVQSERHPSYVDHRVEAFLAKMDVSALVFKKSFFEHPTAWFYVVLHVCWHLDCNMRGIVYFLCTVPAV